MKVEYRAAGWYSLAALSPTTTIYFGGLAEPSPHPPTPHKHSFSSFASQNRPVGPPDFFPVPFDTLGEGFSPHKTSF